MNNILLVWRNAERIRCEEHHGRRDEEVQHGQNWFVISPGYFRCGWLWYLYGVLYILLRFLIYSWTLLTWYLRPKVLSSLSVCEYRPGPDTAVLVMSTLRARPKLQNTGTVQLETVCGAYCCAYILYADSAWKCKNCDCVIQRYNVRRNKKRNLPFARWPGRFFVP